MIHLDSSRWRVLAEGNIRSFSVSADGQTVAYAMRAENQDDIYLARGGDQIRLTDDEAYDASPEVNADGSVVVWSRRNAETRRNEVYRFEEGASQRLSDSADNSQDPEVSADGSVVVWSADEGGQRSHYNIKRWSNGEVTSLTEGEGRREEPVVSQHGSRVYWRQENSYRDHDLWAWDATGESRLLADTGGALGSFQLTPDNNALLVTVRDGSERDLVSFDVQTGQRNDLAAAERVSEEDGTASLDGRLAWTAVERRKPGRDTNIVLRDGSRELQLTWDDGGRHSQPHLSEDGNTLVWLWSDKDDYNHKKIYAMDLSFLG